MLPFKHPRWILKEMLYRFDLLPIYYENYENQIAIPNQLPNNSITVTIDHWKDRREACDKYVFSQCFAPVKKWCVLRKKLFFLSPLRCVLREIFFERFDLIFFFFRLPGKNLMCFARKCFKSLTLFPLFRPPGKYRCVLQ